MSEFIKLNYDELRVITKDMRDKGEDVTLLHFRTRQKVNDLHREWIGEAADKFFAEMETELLPALARLAQGLFVGQDVLLRIIKIINDADLETAGLFKGAFDQIGIFSAGGIGAALGGNLPGIGLPVDFESGIPGGEPIPTDTSGAGSSGQVGGETQQQGQQDAASGSGSQNAGQEPGSADGSGSTSGGSGSSSGSSVGSGRSGTGSSYGSSSSGGSSTSSGSSSTGSQGMPDHIYETGGSSSSAGGPGSASSGAASGGDEGSAAGGGAAAVAAVVGVGGAALGGVVKATRGRKK